MLPVEEALRGEDEDELVELLLFWSARMLDLLLDMEADDEGLILIL